MLFTMHLYPLKIKNSLPDKPRIFNPTVCKGPHEEIQTEV